MANLETKVSNTNLNHLMLTFIIIWKRERKEMPSKRDMLKTDIEIRWKILIIAKETLKFCSSFQNPNTKIERYYVSRDKHLTFIGWSLWRMLIIDLSKLFGDSDNQKYNVMKLLRKLDPAGDYKSLKYAPKYLEGFNRRITELNESIKEISRLRNRFFAHADSDPFIKIETTLTTADCEKLTDLAEEIIRAVASKCIGTDYIVYPLYYNSKDFDMIYTLANLEQEENLKIAEQHKMSHKDLFGYDPL